MAKPNNTHFKVKIPPHTIFNLKFVLQCQAAPNMILNFKFYDRFGAAYITNDISG